MLVFVISLPGSRRRERIAERLGRLGMSFTFIDAVDGRRLAETEVSQVHDDALTWRLHGGPLTRAEIGCALSHRLAYQRLLASDATHAMILEDDAVPSVRLPIMLGFPWSQISADIVSLYSESGHVQRRPSQVFGDVGLHRAFSKISHTVGYVVSRDAAGRLLASHGGRVCTPADWPLGPRELDHYVAAPFLVEHDDIGDSVIEPERQLKTGGQAPPRRPMLRAILVLLWVHYLWRYRDYAGPGTYIDREWAPRFAKLWPWVLMPVRALKAPADPVPGGQIMPLDCGQVVR